MKKKLNLDDLKVKSFITAETLSHAETVKGGKAPPRSYRGDCLVVAEPPRDPEPGISVGWCTGNAPYNCVTGIGCYG
ncbi:MAG: pinensin family lanthipeptide [Bacteroidota bacterium]